MKKLEKAPIPLENNYEKHYSESSFWIGFNLSVVYVQNTLEFLD